MAEGHALLSLRGQGVCTGARKWPLRPCGISYNGSGFFFRVFMPSSSRKFRFHWLAYALLGLMALCALGWFVGNAVVTAKVQARLEALLAENGLSDKLTWQRLDVTVLGVLTAQDVRLQLPDAQLQAASVTVQDFVNDAKRSRFRLDAKQLSLEGNRSPLMALEAFLGGDAPAIQPDLAPMDAQIFWDANWTDNQLSAQTRLDQPGLAAVNVRLELANFKNFYDYVAAEIKAPSERGMVFWRAPVFVLSVAQVRLKALSLEWQDFGARQRWPLSGLKSADCTQPHMGYQWLQEPAHACALVQAFLEGQRPALRLDVAPVKPLSLAVFMPFWQGRYPQQLQRELNAQLSAP